MVAKLQLDRLRHHAIVQVIAADIGEAFKAYPAVSAVADTAAAQFAQRAMQDGFSLGRGVRPIAALSAVCGIGFLHDAQFPQLAALFRDDIKSEEAWRLALLQRWVDWQAACGNPKTAAAVWSRLQALAAMLQEYGTGVVSHDPAALFHAIDPARTATLDPDIWHRITHRWRDAFTKLYPGTTQFQVDYACGLAFCCGQYFPFDPLWQSLADLTPESLFSLVS